MASAARAASRPLLQDEDRYRIGLSHRRAAEVQDRRHTGQHLPAERLELNEVGVCELELDRAIAFEPYERSRDLGGFILVGRASGAQQSARAGRLRIPDN